MDTFALHTFYDFLTYGREPDMMLYFLRIYFGNVIERCTDSYFSRWLTKPNETIRLLPFSTFALWAEDTSG